MLTEILGCSKSPVDLPSANEQKIASQEPIIDFTENLWSLMDKSKQIDKVRADFLEFVSKIPTEELSKVRGIFSQTLPLTHENLDKAINQYTDTENTILLSTYPEWQQKYVLLMKETEKVCKQSETCKQVFIEPFIQIFDKAPEEAKRVIARTPIFPHTSCFEHSLEKPITPLRYIICLGHLEALEKIAPYLDKKDYLEEFYFRGRKRSFLVYLIYRLCNLGGWSSECKTVDCAKFLLKQAPELVLPTEGETPYRYLQENYGLAPKLSPNSKEIMEEGDKLVQLLAEYEKPVGMAQPLERFSSSNIKWL